MSITTNVISDALVITFEDEKNFRFSFIKEDASDGNLRWVGEAFARLLTSTPSQYFRETRSKLEQN